MSLLLAVAVLGGTGCGVSQVQTYAQTYVAPTYQYQAPTYYAPTYYTPYTYSYRASYAGLPVGSEESSRQLMIIEQQSKVLAKVVDQLSNKVEALESEKQVEVDKLRALSEQHRQSEAPVVVPDRQQQQEPRRQEAPPRLDPPPVPEPKRQGNVTVSEQHAGVVALFTQKCGSCHSGEQGKTNDWEMNLQALTNPTPELRIYVTNALNRKTNPMPKGRTLTDKERKAFAEWGFFTKEELKARLVQR